MFIFMAMEKNGIAPRNLQLLKEMPKASRLDWIVLVCVVQAYCIRAP